ncbi:DUF4031 domain-containing protein [Desulfitobacterium hafniense]|uniref:DUF4031 domain-containing protein n=1 Tax=Desulfitobacterium hafniense TaxID=49338 RepID=UPI0003804A9C|nr:DUF4031 domain-containing protein [Desulfitobacterium hafniense]
MIYIDKSGHLVSPDLGELHQFARRLGLRRSWFQEHNPKWPHYDVTSETLRQRAVEMGAVMVGSREIVRMLKG